MANLYKVLRSMAILVIIASIVFISFYLVVAAVVVAGLFGIYRHYFAKKKTKMFETKTKGFTSGEIIDLPK